MTEREDKTPVAPSGAAEEQEILLDSPIVESEDEPGAVDAPGVSGSKEPDEAAVESTPVVEEDAVEPVPPVEEAIAGNPEAAASADADASAGLPEIPEGASSAWPQEETLPAPAAGGEPPAPVDPPSGEEEEPEEERPMTLLEHLGEQPEVTVTWFRPDERKEGGAYLTTTGRLKKIDALGRRLVLLDGTGIPLEDVADLESKCFRKLGQTE